jgi:hypothetical protein
MLVDNNGIVWVFTITSVEERLWVHQNNVVERCQWFLGDTFLMEHAAAAEVALGMLNVGIPLQSAKGARLN